MARHYSCLFSIFSAIAISSCGWIAAPQATAQNQIIVDEQFDGNGVDTSIFTFSGSGDESFFGRTQLNSPQLPGPFDAPTVDNGVLQLELNTYNPFAPGTFFLANEIRTIQQFAPNAQNGLSFETRARFVDDAANPLSPGLIGGAFLFGVDFSASPLVRDEVDFELLSNFPQDTILTNIFNDDGFTSSGNAQFANVPGLDLTEFNDFRIETTLANTQFFVNDQLIRSQTTDLAVDPQDFRLNINAQGPEFAAAFSAELQPTSDPAQNETFLYEVDSLVIAEIDPGMVPLGPPVEYEGELLDDIAQSGSVSALGSFSGTDLAEYWSFFGEEGQTVTFAVSRGESDLDPALWLFEGLFDDTTLLGANFDTSDPSFLAFGDDELAPATGFGPFGDPSITITLPATGSYTLAVNNFASGPNDGGDGRFDYTIQATAAVPVPEPSSMILFALGGFACLRRRA